MYIRRFILLLLFIALMCIGCVQNFTTNTCQEKHKKFTYTEAESAKGLVGEHSEVVYGIAETNDILTLNRALSLTLLFNIELKVFSLEKRASHARLLQMGLRPNPEIEIEIENIGGSEEPRSFDEAETTIQLCQLIELGGKLEKRKEVAALETDLAGFDFQNERLRIFSEATQAFYSVLKAQEKLQLSEELLTLSTESFETVKKIVDAGKDSPVEKNRASVALANIRIAHQKALRNLEFARIKLASFWSQDEPKFERVSGDIYTIEELPELEDLEARLQFNPEYIRWETEIKKSQAQVDLEKSNSIGNISLGAGLKRFSETDDNAFVLGFSVPLPVFDRNQGARQEAVYNLAKSKQQQKAALLKLQNEFNEIYWQFNNAYNMANSMKNEVLPAALEMFDASTKAYEEGKIDYLNLLDTQRTLFNFQNEYIETLAAYHIAKTEIERLTCMEIKSVGSSESEQ